MQEIIDTFCWTKEQKTITHDRHNIEGLGNFAHWTFTSSLEPVSLHYHSNMLEIHCLIKGKRLSQLSKDGSCTEYITLSNEAFITFPFEIHGTGENPRYPGEFYSLQIDLSDPYHLLGLNKDFSYALYQQLMHLPHRQLILGATHIDALRSAFNFFSDLSSDAIKVGVQFLCCFLFSLQFLPSPVQQGKTTANDPHIKDAIDYMLAHVTDKLQLSELADISGYSLSFFKTKFKKEVGITPADYFNLQKFEAAKKLLTETNQSITDIAYALGFSSSSYFSSSFKKLAICTPQIYRKNHSPSLSTSD